MEKGRLAEIPGLMTGSFLTQKAYVEDKSLLLRRVLSWGIVCSVFILAWLGGYPSAQPELKFYMLVAIWIAAVYAYFSCRDREYWIQLDDKCIEHCNSLKKIRETYCYSDIKRIDNFWFGFFLRFKKGCSVRTVRIETSSFKNGRELKAELRQRWMQANG